jgi:hypothetical protein
MTLTRAGDIMVGFLAVGWACVLLLISACTADVHVGDSADNVAEATTPDMQTTIWRGDRRFEEATDESNSRCIEVRIVSLNHENDYTVVAFSDGTRGLRAGVWGTEIGETFCAQRIAVNKLTKIQDWHSYERAVEVSKYDVTWR